jgi:hypothetical protein
MHGATHIRILPSLSQLHRCEKLAIVNLLLLMKWTRHKWVPVTTAWRILSLGKEERPPDMEGSCEYTE